LRGNVAIHPRFNKLFNALRIAVENGKGVPDRERHEIIKMLIPDEYIQKILLAKY
jgi:hypothetical protein